MQDAGAPGGGSPVGDDADDGAPPRPTLAAVMAAAANAVRAVHRFKAPVFTPSAPAKAATSLNRGSIHPAPPPPRPRPDNGDADGGWGDRHDAASPPPLVVAEAAHLSAACAECSCAAFTGSHDAECTACGHGAQSHRRFTESTSHHSGHGGVFRPGAPASSGLVSSLNDEPEVVAPAHGRGHAVDRWRNAVKFRFLPAARMARRSTLKLPPTESFSAGCGQCECGAFVCRAGEEDAEGAAAGRRVCQTCGHAARAHNKFV